MSILHALVAEFDHIRANLHGLLNPEAAMAAKTEQIWRELVAKAHDVEDRLGKIEAHLFPAEPTPANSQPEVEQNTRSGAAPEAPVAQPASDGAVQPPAAAGTAPESQPQA